MTLIAIVEAMRALIAHFEHKTVPGWTSLMVVICLNNAALMIAVGILGEYVGRIYEESKARPLYVVAESWNMTSCPAFRLDIASEEQAVPTTGNRFD